MRADSGTNRKEGYYCFVAQEDIDTTTRKADTTRVHLILCSLGSFSGETLQSVGAGRILGRELFP